VIRRLLAIQQKVRLFSATATAITARVATITTVIGMTSAATTVFTRTGVAYHRRSRCRCYHRQYKQKEDKRHHHEVPNYGPCHHDKDAVIDPVLNEYIFVKKKSSDFAVVYLIEFLTPGYAM
jgi:hypothetical protein